MAVPQTYIIKNQEIEVHISNFGAIIQKMIVKDGNGQFIDVVLGFDSIEAYLCPEYLKNYSYLGAAMGRYANRIGGASFMLNGKRYFLKKNANNDHLHGGVEGFDKKSWNVENIDKEKLSLKYISRDGEEGYPGNLSTTIEFSLKNRSLHIHNVAICDQDCFVNLTHHPYFNLFPKDTTVQRHHLQIFSCKQLETNNLIPTGAIIDCSDFTDFSKQKSLDDVIENHGGLDHTFLFKEDRKLKPMAFLSHPESLLHLNIISDYPSMQVYTGAFLNIKNGKDGNDYLPFSGIAFEPQLYPDAPNHSNFPTALLKKNELFDRTIIYSFD